MLYHKINEIIFYSMINDYIIYYLKSYLSCVNDKKKDNQILI